MQYLNCALYAEGKTDYAFLRPLLLRLCEDVCARSATQQVDIPEVLEIRHPIETSETSRAVRIAQAAQSADRQWRILFVHADSDGDSDRALAERVEPGLALLRQRAGDNLQGIPVIPVRETEAWAIVDPDAIRAGFGSTLTDTELGLSSFPRRVEKILDPKLALERALAAARPTRRRARLTITPFLGTLGERVRLEKLRELSAFNEMEACLRDALRQMRILPDNR